MLAARRPVASTLIEGEVFVIGLLHDPGRRAAPVRELDGQRVAARPRRACWSGCSRPPSGSHPSRRRSTGCSGKPRVETPSDVMVTTESRTAATTSVSGGADAVAPFVPVAVVTAAPPPAPLLGVAPPLSGPVTSAAVPPAASTAERTAAATSVAVPRRRDGDRSCVAVVAEGTAGAKVAADGWPGVELDGARGVIGGGVAPRSWSNIGSSDRAGVAGIGAMVLSNTRTLRRC